MNAIPPKTDSALILVIDDDRFMRLQVRHAMEQQGYRVAEAANGEEGLAAYTCLEPDIVLMDAIMPVMDGFTCCKLLQKLPGSDRTPVLMITVLDDADAVNLAFEAGASDYITKPLHWAVLRQRVRRLLEARRAAEELRQQIERERLIDRIAHRIRESLELEEILNTTVAQVRQFLECDRVLIYRFDSDWSGRVVVESVDERWTPILGQTIAYPYVRKNYIPSYQQNRTHAKEDIYTIGLPQCLIDSLANFQVRAHLVVPILRKQELWGLLIAHQCRGPREWEYLEIELLKDLATQLGIAIQQAALYQQLSKLNSQLESQVRERTERLQQALNFEAMLKRITDKVRDSMDESNILQTAVQELALGLEIRYCGTALYNLKKATATIGYECVNSSPQGRDRVVEMEKFPGIYPQLFKGECVQFCEIPSDAMQPMGSLVSALACPIFDDRGTLGDLWLLNHGEYIFNELEVRLVQQVANQCAIAIRQARLYQAARDKVEKLEKLNLLKDELLDKFTEELKTPLSARKMLIQ